MVFFNNKVKPKGSSRERSVHKTSGDRELVVQKDDKGNTRFIEKRSVRRGSASSAAALKRRSSLSLKVLSSKMNEKMKAAFWKKLHEPALVAQVVWGISIQLSMACLLVVLCFARLSYVTVDYSSDSDAIDEPVAIITTNHLPMNLSNFAVVFGFSIFLYARSVHSMSGMLLDNGTTLSIEQAFEYASYAPFYIFLLAIVQQVILYVPMMIGSDYKLSYYFLDTFLLLLFHVVSVVIDSSMRSKLMTADALLGKAVAPVNDEAKER